MLTGVDELETTVHPGSTPTTTVVESDPNAPSPDAVTKLPTTATLDATVEVDSSACEDGGKDCLPDATTAPDAPTSPTTATFTVTLTDCDGSRCRGGSNGVMDQAELQTATAQCVKRAFVEATGFTIGGRPGGRFCSYRNGAYGCDPGCDSCNVMATITCKKP